LKRPSRRCKLKASASRNRTSNRTRKPRIWMWRTRMVIRSICYGKS